MNRTRLDVEQMVLEWLAQNQKVANQVQHIEVPLGFVSTLAEHMDAPGKRRPGNWYTARTFPACPHGAALMDCGTCNPGARP